MRTTKKEKFSKIILGLAAVTAVTVVAGLVWAGDLEPNAAPGPTFKTLDEIPGTWSRILPADDGEADGCNSSRFDCVMGGDAVLDKETGLVWERNPNQGENGFITAIRLCLQTSTGARRGWRLPSVTELATLLDPNNTNGDPDLPLGHPFTNVRYRFYWSATGDASFANYSWSVDFETGDIFSYREASNIFGIWCVRGAMNADQH